MGDKPIEIREERPEDIDAIREVNRRAFGQELEGRLVDALRTNGGVLLSLVATLEGRIVGHVLYSPIVVADANEGAALGPMSVLPDHQRHGVGSRLVEGGNQRIKEAGYPFIIVLGHPAYYPRFGFEPARLFGIQCQWDVPDDVFMILPLDAARARAVAGLARYRPEFQAL